MKKSNMLCKNWEFESIINTKQQFISKGLIVYYRKADEFKVGISVPKKFANAVHRNYYKRQVKAIFEHIDDYESLKYHLVIIVRRAFLNLDFQVKTNELIKLLERIKVGR